MPPSAIEIVEYTDPGCSWSWGSEPKLRLLQWRYGGGLRWRRVMGGLVGNLDNYLPGADLEQAAAGFSGYWAGVSATTGMPYPARLARMYRSTEPACRAVKAAERQGEPVAGAVLRRLREATFVFGDPPDTSERILAAVGGVPGLDPDRLASDLGSDEVEAAFRADWSETRAPNEYVMNLEDEGEGSGRAKQSEGHWRYVFPTVVVRGPEGEATVPGWKPLEDYVAAIEAAAPGSTGDPRPDPSVEEAFQIWPSLAAAELAALCGAGASPPSSAAALDLGGGVLYRSEAGAWVTSPAPPGA